MEKNGVEKNGVCNEAMCPWCYIPVGVRNDDSAKLKWNCLGCGSTGIEVLVGAW